MTRFQLSYWIMTWLVSSLTWIMTITWPRHYIWIPVFKDPLGKKSKILYNFFNGKGEQCDVISELKGRLSIYKLSPLYLSFIYIYLFIILFIIMFFSIFNLMIWTILSMLSHLVLSSISFIHTCMPSRFFYILF